ncbi:glycosyltransferase family 4 protein [Patescibacteria group bacterium]
MIIGIDANEANIGKRVGVNVIAFELLWGLYKLKPKNINFRILLSNSPLSDLPKQTNWWQYEVFGPSSFWTFTGLPKRLYFAKPKIDVMFSPSHYGPLISPVPFVVSIMDLGFLRWPEQFTKKDYFQLKYGTRQSVKKATKVITISEFSKKDIVETYKTRSEKVEVVFPGYKKPENLKVDTQIVKQKFSLEDDYLLYLGTLKPSKNISKLIKAFKMFVLKYPKTKLVLAGKKGWLYKEIFALVKKLNLEEKIVFTGYVSEKDKLALLKKAKALILSSLWEGFGIPVLEAFGSNTPVICSKLASLPEVAGDAAIYIKNPNSVNSIYLSLIKMVKLSQEQRNRLIEKGKKQLDRFSWEKAAKKTLLILKKVGENKK